MRKLTLGILGCFALLTDIKAQEISTLFFDDQTGDKISLFNNAIGNPTMSGLGVESNALYFKARDRYRWYINSNASNGQSDVMELNPNGLLVNAVGIGLNPSTASTAYGDYVQPQAMLHINSAVEDQTFRIYKEGNTAQYLNIFQGTNRAVIDPVGSGVLYLGDAQPTDVIVKGRLAVGTTQLNGYELAVKGIIGCGGLQVKDVSGWADFVFEDNYRLQSLDEVESFISHNKHLPDVPSEQEVMENGINVASMSATLLQKIEELTLYTIELQKQVDALK